jgi:GntR family transcriptional repressor for pyruvate dehydrogenase complex
MDPAEGMMVASTLAFGFAIVDRPAEPILGIWKAMVVQGGRLEGGRSYQLVARAIEKQIVDGLIAPGDVLPAETAFAAQLGVNRSTLREALRALEQNGLVHREVGRKKLRVSPRRASELSRRFAAAMVGQQVSFEELYEAIYALEPASAAAAATRCDADLLAALEDNLTRTRQALDDRASLMELDVEFHRLVAKAAKNRAMYLARQPLGDLFYPAFYVLMSRLNAAERLLAAHEHIVAAIRERDVATARAWMERHIADFRRGYELANLDITNPVSVTADA